MKKLVKYLLFLIIVGSNISLFSQTTGKLSGKVFNSESGEPLYGANIIIEKIDIGTTSDRDGNFVIMDIPTGNYRVNVSYIGFATHIIKNVSIKIDKTTFIEVPMQQKGIQGQEIIVSAQREAIEKDKTYSSSDFETDVINRMPSEGLRDIMKQDASLRENPDGTYSMRGGGSFDINFMVDGVSQQNSNTGVPGTNFMGTRANTSWKYDFNPLGVKQMEIISGGFSAEYGKAQSGVVKVVSKEGSEEFEGQVKFEYRPPGKYHFGDYIYNRDQFEWENWGEFQDWIDWRDENNPNVNNDSLRYLYDMWIKNHTPSSGNYLGPYDYRDMVYKRVLFGFGGPIGKFPGSTFYLSGEKRSKPTRLPTSEKTVQYDNVNLTTFFKISDELKMRMSLQYQHSYSGIFSGANDIRWSSPVGNISFNGGQRKYLLVTVPPKDEYNWTQNMILTYIPSPETFYKLQISHNYEMYNIGNIPVDKDKQVPSGPWDEGYTRLVWEPAGSVYNQDVRTHTYTVKASMTHQFSSSNHFKMGLHSNIWDMHYHSVSSLYANALVYRSGFAEYYKATPIYFAAYAQDKMEYKGLIANIGLRVDGYNSNVKMPADIWDPFYPGTMGNAIGNPETTMPSTHITLSPRTGLSFPIGENTAFRLQYGHFYDMPEFRQLLSRGTWQGWVMYGNPDLGFEKTIQYEFGLQHSFNRNHRLDLVAFYNDRTRQTTAIRRHFDTGSVARSVSDPYASTYVNRGYGTTKGLEFSVERIRTSNLHYRFSYNLSRSTTAYYGPTAIWEETDPNRPIDMTPYIQRGNSNLTDDDRTHSFTAFVSYSTPESYGIHLGNFYPLENVTMSLTYRANSGRPYTYITEYDDFFDVVNNRRYPLEYITNLNLTKTFNIYGQQLSLSCKIQNLFNNRWLTPFHPQAEMDDLRKWVESGLTWNDPEHPHYKYNYHRAYRNIPRQIFISMDVKL